ncbi:MAG: hypothetical protein ACRDDF_09140 [Aeromonas sp.]
MDTLAERRSWLAHRWAMDGRWALPFPGPLTWSSNSGKRKGGAISAAQCQEREKTLRFKIKKIWKQTIDFSTRKGLEFDTFRLCAMFYAALAKCLQVERYALSGVIF